MYDDLSGAPFYLAHIQAAPRQGGGRRWVEYVCRPITPAWARLGFRALLVTHGYGRRTALNPARWAAPIPFVANPISLAALANLLWAVGRSASPWRSWEMWGVGAAMGLVVGLMGVTALLERLMAPIGPTHLPGCALYVELQAAWRAPRAFRAAWWRRVRRTLGDDHIVLAYLLDAHGADGGIPGLTTDDILPLLQSAAASTRAAALAATVGCAALAETRRVARSAPRMVRDAHG